MHVTGKALGFADGRLLGESTTLNALAKEIHENAVAHGWWDEPRSFGEVVALCHSELSEALEEYRDGRPMLYCDTGKTFEMPCASGANCVGLQCAKFKISESEKPEGIAVEMADCIIRILDWCGKEGVDIDGVLRIKMEYNQTRPYRHGGKVL